VFLKWGEEEEEEKEEEEEEEKDEKTLTIRVWSLRVILVSEKKALKSFFKCLKKKRPLVFPTWKRSAKVLQQLGKF